MKKLLLSLLIIVLVLFSIAVLTGCEPYQPPEPYINTIPGNYNRYTPFEIEGIMYYMLSSGVVVCPERDRAIIEMSKNFESVHLPYY